MRVVAAVMLVGVLGGCTSVKMVQRDGCWVRRTEKRLLGTVAEEVGPCARPVTAFVENDPLTRMVQECVARADYRWQMRALAAWDRHEPWPAQLTESSVLQQCMDDSARGVLTETASLKDRNAALEKRVSELVQEQRAMLQRSDQERKELFSMSEQERKDLLALQSKLGDHLGAAATKVQPLPPVQPAAPAIATATATSEGRGTSEQATDSQAQPATLAIVPQSGPAGPVTATATMTPAGAATAMCPSVPSSSPRASTDKKAPEVARHARAVKKARSKQPATATCPPAQTSASADGKTAQTASADGKTAASASAPAPTSANAVTPTSANAATPVVEASPSKGSQTARR